MASNMALKSPIVKIQNRMDNKNTLLPRNLVTLNLNNNKILIFPDYNKMKLQSLVSLNLSFNKINYFSIEKAIEYPCL